VDPRKAGLDKAEPEIELVLGEFVPETGHPTNPVPVSHWQPAGCQPEPPFDASVLLWHQYTPLGDRVCVTDQERCNLGMFERSRRDFVSPGLERQTRM
jgi:hypothetical protein